MTKNEQNKMRDIRFRAWDKKENAMLDVSHWTINMLNEMRMPIMQFTGLKDKDGKEIYEGDIVVFLPLRRKDLSPAVVEWSDDGAYFRLRSIKNGLPLGHWLLHFVGRYRANGREVIGNIHQNPELLT